MVEKRSSACWRPSFNWHAPQAQIDLVIDRKDQVVNLCEMKFSIDKFTINKTYHENLRRKISVFREATATRKAIFLTMLTTYGLEENAYSGIAQNSLTMQVLFRPLEEYL